MARMQTPHPVHSQDTGPDLLGSCIDMGALARGHRGAERTSMGGTAGPVKNVSPRGRATRSHFVQKSHPWSCT